MSCTKIQCVDILRVCAKNSPYILWSYQALGEQEIVRVCRQILWDEMETATWLEQQLPLIVQEYIGQQAREYSAG
jgi:hypothetical protein